MCSGSLSQLMFVIGRIWSGNHASRASSILITGRGARRRMKSSEVLWAIRNPAFAIGPDDTDIPAARRRLYHCILDGCLAIDAEPVCAQYGCSLAELAQQIVSISSRAHDRSFGVVSLQDDGFMRIVRQAALCWYWLET